MVIDSHLPKKLPTASRQVLGHPYVDTTKTARQAQVHASCSFTTIHTSSSSRNVPAAYSTTPGRTRWILCWKAASCSAFCSFLVAYHQSCLQQKILLSGVQQPVNWGISQLCVYVWMPCKWHHLGNYQYPNHSSASLVPFLVDVFPLTNRILSKTKSPWLMFNFWWPRLQKNMKPPNPAYKGTEWDEWLAGQTLYEWSHLWATQKHSMRITFPGISNIIGHFASAKIRRVCVMVLTFPFASTIGETLR